MTRAPTATATTSSPAQGCPPTVRRRAERQRLGASRRVASGSLDQGVPTTGREPATAASAEVLVQRPRLRDHHWRRLMRRKISAARHAPSTMIKALVRVVRFRVTNDLDGRDCTGVWRRGSDSRWPLAAASCWTTVIAAWVSLSGLFPVGGASDATVPAEPLIGWPARV